MGTRTTGQEDLTVTEAAAALSTTPMAILMLMRRGELVGIEVDGSWQITAASLEKVLAGKKTDEPLVECRSSCAAKAGGCASCGSSAE